MKKFRRVLKIISRYLFLFALILSFLFIAQEYTRPYIPLPLFLTAKAQIQIFLIIFYVFLFIPTLYLLELKPIYNFVVIIITIIPVIFLLSIFLNTEKLLSSTSLENKNYHLIVEHEIGDPLVNCYLYECDNNDLSCREIESSWKECPGYKQSFLLADPTKMEIHAFIDMTWQNKLQMVYTYGSQPRSYLDKIELADNIFYLAYYYDHGISNPIFIYMLYKCKSDNTSCERLPFQYSNTKNELLNTEIAFDNQTNNLQIFIADKLIYTYGTTAKCYVEGCSLVK